MRRWQVHNRRSEPSHTRGVRLAPLDCSTGMCMGMCMALGTANGRGAHC